MTNILVDANGGINGMASNTLTSGYVRNGLFLYNFYNLVITGIAQDFRSKYNGTRQHLGISCIAANPFISSESDVKIGGYYRIKSLNTTGSGTDALFTSIMGSQLTPQSGTIGTVFQAAWNYTPPYPSGYFHSGELEAVNDVLTLNFGISDSLDQIIGGGPGYDLGGLGSNCI